ncbi:hypothetical protein D3C78_1286720 [compost metagenome]
MVDVARQQDLLGFDSPLRGDHCWLLAMDDVQHFGVLEDQRAQAMRCTGFAQAQVERVQVQVAQVLQRAQVQRALQVFGHGVAIEQLHLVAHAAALRFGCESLQLMHVRGLHRRMQVTALEVAVDAIACDPLFDDLMPAPAQVPDEVVDVFAELFAHLLAHRLVTRKAASHLAAVATAGAPTNAVGLDNGDFQAAFG